MWSAGRVVSLVNIRQAKRAEGLAPNPRQGLGPLFPSRNGSGISGVMLDLLMKQ